MAPGAVSAERAAHVSRGYRRVLVPVRGTPESDRAIVAACRLAAERHAEVTALAVIEVPPLLPLDAHMHDEEEDARKVLDRAQAIGDAYGVPVVLRRIRARDAATAIVERVEVGSFELLAMGARRRLRSHKHAPAFGSTVQHVLRRATCRVLVVAAPLD